MQRATKGRCTLCSASKVLGRGAPSTRSNCPGSVARRQCVACRASCVHRYQPDRYESEDTLRLSVAGWVAGELFRRAVGTTESIDKLSDTRRQSATEQVGKTMVQRYAALTEAPKSENILGKKAIDHFNKWALHDKDIGLSDEELNELARWSGLATRPPHRFQALLQLLDAWMDARSPRWLMGWRDIARNTDQRTVIASALPRVGVGHTMPLFSCLQPTNLQAALLANLTSLVLDYIARQKVGGTHLTYGYLKQLPVLTPGSYTSADLLFIAPRMLELTYTANDLRDWAEDLWLHRPPFPFGI